MDDTNVLGEDLQRRYHDLLKKTQAVVSANNRRRTWREQISHGGFYFGALTITPFASIALIPTAFTAPEMIAALCGAGMASGVALSGVWPKISTATTRHREKKTEAEWYDAREDFLEWGHDAATAVKEAGAGTLTVRPGLGWDEQASSPLMRLDTPIGTTRVVSPFIAGTSVWLRDTEGDVVRRSYASMLERAMRDSSGYESLLPGLNEDLN